MNFSGRFSYKVNTLYPGSRPGTQASFPKVRLVLLIEAGTHLIVDALMCGAGDAPPPVRIALAKELGLRSYYARLHKVCC
jgi:hypothetical protein